MGKQAWQLRSGVGKGKEKKSGRSSLSLFHLHGSLALTQPVSLRPDILAPAEHIYIIPVPRDDLDCSDIERKTQRLAEKWQAKEGDSLTGDTSSLKERRKRGRTDSSIILSWEGDSDWWRGRHGGMENIP